ncbi:alpha/beta-hydrolase [Auriculariales sp. MPI-PUGE-AT-0066]|nr:alpha/beta-hydrolase [Auriculariales sp. MPI-PUGE-AT-0066]
MDLPFIEKDEARSVSSSPTAASSHLPSLPNSPYGHVSRRPPVRRRTRFVESPEGSLLLFPGGEQLTPPPPGPSPLRRDLDRPETPLPVAEDSAILSSLHALHADELVYLFKNRKKVLGEHQYRSHAFVTFKKYLFFLWFTWSRAVWNIVMLPTTILDIVSIIAFAFASSAVLTALLAWCLIINFPFIHALYDTWARQYANGLSLTNCLHPEIFDELSAQEMDHSFEALSLPIADCSNTDTKRHFNLDIAKLLLQCSAVMYERTSAALYEALETEADDHPTRGHRVDSNPDGSVPGALLANALGSNAAAAVNKSLHNHSEENKVHAFARQHGLEYSTVSELNSQSSAACGMFYDPNGTFIILAYKGTSLEEFGEWASDFTFEPSHAGHWIRGFGKCHGGFFSKIFPKRIDRGTRMPYNTIKKAIQVCASQLLQNQPAGTQINVWTTGHSLGCALASLVYARQINEPGDFGRSIVIRDAYLFASPILCDIQSVHSFNNRMHHASSVHGNHPRTMWRVTNAKDIVATGLPNLGDHPEWGMSPYNLFSFAHLGSEIRLRQHPERCIISGNHITNGSNVRVVSSFRRTNTPSADHPSQMQKQRHHKTFFARAGLRKLERIPILGRLLSHGTAFYWLALRDASVGNCEWDD